MAVLNQKSVFVVGRVGVDFFSKDSGKSLVDARNFIKTQGGSASNIAVNLSKLGLQVSLVTKVGKEPLGNFLIKYLKGFGVNTSFISQDPNHKTSLAVVEVLPPDSFTTLFFRECCADLQLKYEDLPMEDIRNSHLLVSTGGSLTSLPARETVLKLLEELKNYDTIIKVFDIDYRSSLWKDKDTARKYLRAAAEMADIIFANEDELNLLGDGLTPESLAKELHLKGIKYVIYKRGSRGAIIYAPDNKLEITPYPSEIVSTNGAGDAFAAGFCYGLLLEWPLEKCAKFGSAAGAVVVSRIGCSEAMPSREEILALINKYNQ